uniref:Uncharacterized protein n=1 Tax=Strigamia maritima TaxID=126957 RepID=T1IRW7_STRMM
MERHRLVEDRQRVKNWKRWGPYLSERQWGTVREDYSPNGECWDYFKHDDSRSRVYRWGEDGLLGFTDRQCRLCFALALWNKKDPILKERLYGLTGSQGNHGEDVKELYYYLESSPTHSYMKSLYKYPQCAYPYEQIEKGNRGRSREESELELEDLGVFKERNYWDVFAEYAKNTPNDILIKVTLINRSKDKAEIALLPTLWFRNTWVWGCTGHEDYSKKPKLCKRSDGVVECTHDTLGTFFWEVEDVAGSKLVFTENETNMTKLYGVAQATDFVKDGFHRYIIEGDGSAVNPRECGTKAAACYNLAVAGGGKATIRARLYHNEEKPATTFGDSFNEVFERRKLESEEYFRDICANLPQEHLPIARQSMAGLLYSKQFYHYIVRDWLHGDPDQMPPPKSRLDGRNWEWIHLYNRDIISVPDKWEYPWYASWDLAFHMIPFAIFDIEFAKHQLSLFLKEWYMHPNGQIPAYEFNFGDVNPPVHAWAVAKVYTLSGQRGQRDIDFLRRCFHKLIINFTWWVNRKDMNGNNIFAGGFLGLDNIGIFDRNQPPEGFQLEQADGTAWMATFCVMMLNMALELAAIDIIYDELASKFFEHFILIVDAINRFGHGGGLWDEKDGFYYDYIRTDDGKDIPLRVRSLVGLVPMFACLVLEESKLKNVEGFMKRTRWFIKYRQDITSEISFMVEGEHHRYLLAVPNKTRLLSILKYMLDEDEFLSPYGIRSLSKVHKDHPFVLNLPNHPPASVAYVPGDSNTYMFGGNSNWRGPIWLCMNYLIIEVLERYHYYYGNSFKVECPTRSKCLMTLNEVAKEINGRLVKLFLPDPSGRRPCHSDSELYKEDPAFKELILFYEFFHGDNGKGLGASHQGWTYGILSALFRAQGVKPKPTEE